MPTENSFFYQELGKGINNPLLPAANFKLFDDKKINPFL